MRKTVFRALGTLMLATLALAAPSRAADDVVMKALHDELDRSMKQLQLEQLEKPYFISYRVQDRTALDTSATFGGLLTGGVTRVRFLTVQVRVGDYQLDNSNFMTDPPKANGLTENTVLPIDDDYQELRRQIWLATDTAYKAALEILSRKRAALENRQVRDPLTAVRLLQYHFTGKERDSESGNDYFGARYLNSSMDGFMESGDGPDAGAEGAGRIAGVV